MQHVLCVCVCVLHMHPFRLLITALIFCRVLTFTMTCCVMCSLYYTLTLSASMSSGIIPALKTNKFSSFTPRIHTGAYSYDIGPRADNLAPGSCSVFKGTLEEAQTRCDQDSMCKLGGGVRVVLCLTQFSGGLCFARQT